MSESINRSKNASKEKVKSVRSWIGFLFAILAAISSATGSLFFKIVDENKMIVVMIRSIFQFLLFIPIMTVTGKEFAGKDRSTNLLLLIRGSLSPIMMTLIGSSMNYLTLGDAMAIFYTYPALVGVFAWICLRG